MGTDLLTIIKWKLSDNGYVDVVTALTEEYNSGATSTEKLVNVGCFLNDLLNKDNNLRILIGDNLKEFNYKLREQGIDLIEFD